jgi:hypothetical protein
MKHDGIVNEAMWSKDKSRILSSFDALTVRLWDSRWPGGNLLEVGCVLLPDHDLSEVSRRYGITVQRFRKA